MERPLTEPSVRRVALLVAYDGRNTCGWQIQRHGRTVQGTLEDACLTAFGRAVRITGAGRTDAGVSAWGQVAHADIPGDCPVPDDRLEHLLNRALPPEIRIFGSVGVAPSFHARHSARMKIYCYAFRWLPDSLRRHPGDRPFSGPIHRPFVLERAERAGRIFLGAHDFRHFTVAASCPEETVRTISGIFWERTPDGLSLWISGPGFLHKMVRMIGGYLRDVATGARTAEDLPLLLERGSPPPLRPVDPLPPEGLSLVRVLYRPPDPFDPRTGTG